MFEKVTKLALFSRVLVIILQFLSNAMFTDHKPDVFRKPIIENGKSVADHMVELVFNGLRHWDGEYFLHVAEHGYSYENTLAFYPAYPLTVRYLAKFLHKIGFGLTLHNWMLLVAVGLNVSFFCLAANKLYELSHYIFDDLYKSWHSVLLFCFNPASIFFTATYSEALYCWLTFSLMLECVKENRAIRTIIFLSFSIITRSNGLTNIGFPIYFTFYHIVSHAGKSVLKILKLFSVILVSLIPLNLFNFYAYQEYCWPTHETLHHPQIKAYALERGYLLAGKQNISNSSPWCKYSFPFPYSYIQSHYWNVGLFRYYEWKQLPNFLLALPILSYLFFNTMKVIKQTSLKLVKQSFPIFITDNKIIPFVVHCLFLTIFCTLFVHIQISTRLLCSATPCLYWYAASYLPKTLDRIKPKSTAFSTFAWCGSYYLLGTILFANNVPWT